MRSQGGVIAASKESPLRGNDEDIQICRRTLAGLAITGLALSFAPASASASAVSFNRVPDKTGIGSIELTVKSDLIVYAGIDGYVGEDGGSQIRRDGTTCNHGQWTPGAPGRSCS